MKKISGSFNPAQEIAQRMRTLETELARARASSRRDQRGTDSSARWGLEPGLHASDQEESWFITYLDVMTLLLVVMIVMLAFSGSLQKLNKFPPDERVKAIKEALASTQAEPQAPDSIVVAQIPEPEIAAPYPAIDGADFAAGATGPANKSVLGGMLPDFEAEEEAERLARLPPPAPQTDADADAQLEPAPSPYDREIPVFAELAALEASARAQALAMATQGAPKPGDPAHASAIPSAELPAIPEPEIPEPPKPMAVEAQAPEPAPSAPEPSEGELLASALPLGELGQGVEVIVNQRSVSFRINNEILFDTGQTDLSLAGLAVLQRTARVLSEAGYEITVEGHTDSVPVRRNSRFPSNWELSSARAGSVVRYLQANGIDKKHLKAVGYADSRPLADNASATGRAANRRVELVVEKMPTEEPN